MGEKLPDADEFPWSAESATLLEETDKTSIKAVVTTIKKKCDDKACKEACMQAVTDLASWAKEQKVLWLEPYLITVFEQIMACLLYTSPSPRDLSTSRMPSSA